jgi:hypothetical protein
MAEEDDAWRDVAAVHDRSEHVQKGRVVDGSPFVYPCVCCGRLTLEEAPGNYEICPVCFWEDDAVQLRYPLSQGGANHVSLVEAQANYAALGASEKRVVPHVRAASGSEVVEEGWRPVDPENDRFEHEPESDWPEDLTALYWWRATYWRASSV